MIKHEIKVDFKNSNDLTNLIEKSYFLDGDTGKILKKEHYLKIDESKDIDYSIFKGLDGATVKLLNDDVVDGSMRFMVEEVDSEIRLYPISIYAIKEGNRYSFY
jgi:hypothetical protein